MPQECHANWMSEIADTTLSAADKFHGIWDKAPAGAAPIKDLLLLDLRPVEMESQLEKQTAAGMKLQQLFSYQWTAWTYYGAYLTAGIPERRWYHGQRSLNMTCCSVAWPASLA